MESEYNRESETPKEVTAQETPPAPKLSKHGQMNMSTPPPPEDETRTAPSAPAAVEKSAESEKHPLPRPDNPETKEISGSSEATPGRDDGLPKSPQPGVDDPTAAGRRRIQATLDSNQPVDPTPPKPTGDTTIPPVSPPLPTSDTTIPPVSPPLPTGDTTIPPVSLPLPTGDTTIPPVSPPLPTGDTTIPPVSPPLPTDDTTIPPVSPPLPTGDTTIPPVSPPLPTGDTTIPPAPTDHAGLPSGDVSAPVLDTLPDGRLAVVSGNPEMKKQFTHPQGTSTLEYITPDGTPLKYNGTCGIVSCEDVAKQQGINVTEDDLVRLAAEKNLCVNDVPNSDKLGGTTDAGRAALLKEISVPNEMVSASSLEELAGHIENDQGAIAAVNAGVLWNDANYLGNGSANHAIVPTGVARDPQSNQILGFFINDSGTGDAGKFISSPRFENAWLNRGGRLNITQPRRKE